MSKPASLNYMVDFVYPPLLTFGVSCSVQSLTIFLSPVVISIESTFDCSLLLIVLLVPNSQNPNLVCIKVRLLLYVSLLNYCQAF